MRKLFYILIVCCFIYGCNFEPKSELLKNHQAKVLIMLAPDCPLCKNYTLDIKSLQENYSDRLDIKAVVPGTFYTEFQVDSFLRHYDVNLDVIYDPNFVLVNDLGATITPEVFLIDENNTVLYEGKFDNWLGELGRRRQVVSEYYLIDAIEAYLNEEEIKIKKTKAIGCFIE